MQQDTTCPDCAAYRAEGARFCGTCGRPLGPGCDSVRRAPASVASKIKVATALLAGIVLAMEAGFLIAGFGSVWNWCDGHSMKVLGLVPHLVVLTTIDGTALKIAWLLIAAAVLGSLAVVAWRTWRSVRSDSEHASDAVARSDLYAVGAVFGATLVIDIALSLIMAAFGESITVPDGMATGTDPEALLDFADAAVWEEVISRLVPMGIPMAVIAFASRRDRPWRMLLGGFGISRSVLVLIAISALMFGFAHSSGWGLTKVAPTFASGLLFGYLYAKVGIHASIAVHFLTDYMAVVAYSEIMPAMLIMSLALLAFIVLGAICMALHLISAKGKLERLRTLPTWMPDEENSLSSRGRERRAESSDFDSMIQFPRYPDSLRIA